MAPVTATPRRGLRWLVDAVLASYAQVFFSEARLAGLVLLLATVFAPWAGLLGLGAVLWAIALVRVAHFNLERAGRGLYGFNALFLGLALGTWFEPSAGAVLAVALGVAGLVLLQVSLETALGYYLGLPSVSLPFVVVAHLAWLASAAVAGLSPAPATLPAADASFWGGYLASLGAVFFQPTWLAGALVLLALVLSSRIAALLSLVGYAVAMGLLAVVHPSVAVAPALVGLNALLVAVALGGIWFVPQGSSFVLAAVGAALASVLTLALWGALQPLGLPVVVLPFNLSVLLAVYALRQRLRDAAPKTVDFVAGSPEVNLVYYRTRVARFGRLRTTRLALPFSGRWTVTQGVDGAHTHTGLWRHALDFEVLGPDGRAFKHQGAELRDYHCYRLPVLAPADGRVVKVVRDVPDNPPGQRNPTDPWGNLVVLEHAPGLYSLVCHLAPGSVDVAEGQGVRQGARLGLCGNSGRSFVPHLHLQLQASPRVGAPTVELELHDVATVTGDAVTLARACTPGEGAQVRNLERRDDLARLFDVRVGTRWRFEVRDGAGAPRVEEVTAHLDLLNNLFLESSLGGRLYFDSLARQFVVYDVQAPRRSVLALVHAALLRVPYEVADGLSWDDVVPRRHLRPAALAWLTDAAAPFLGDDEELVRFTSELRGDALVVRGAGRGLETYARLSPRGPLELTLTSGGVTRRATLLEPTHAEVEPQAGRIADAGVHAG
ncbi:MAG: urea transporter [Myxococcaceae bacterium]|nr:urea transporter [Myxococcaceae bacterium]